ncbi:ATP-binding cassette sub-family G member 1 [Contarinia nasturtii]|uniref:ATP-binding cassette sub-family G member 1 n=1 Tax=Contarinia nasturtii TaxID=265458 RepID=UPI0012D3C9A5|nr:ATP-binding cassette sub-family G member 1 [Contarinia nasturtii]XP_031640930.1 ATP-binding cassette sub-family G member 1 [Contarinia nasturtii]XP_031640932.1 ATP-binding cassette sub-family G member 1 [Contarinia nasturtii]XP_031640933.1 ATP-binding cassette sub-family G member 1 [Contarinia nasturtii]XP_031640934.1 ATP-binding cassette sub-family G member 1 [Contarinia nasturtii]XP_031640935.1 ATP-binding cassette sub-family G member 1 [Contarinia nasturtii]XP_031640936.1 ATP-binding ca
MDYSLTERQINLPMGNITNEQNGINGNGNGYTNHFELSNGLCMSNRDPIDLQFKNITYTVNLGFYKGSKEILHKVNGKFPSGQLTAIMGPSGAGKSTLLDVLSGYRITGVNGEVYTNGRMRNLNEFRRVSCYITQEDRIQTLLTVLENMQIAADFKLGNTFKDHEKAARIEEILTLLGLYEHQNTISKRLSGGQKKRLSIALELINNPTVMFLDEPTTGLDSHSCYQVVSLLKQLAAQGRTIICTIHQPSARLFQQFEQVYILAMGECLYQGGTEKIVPYLQSVNLPCPMYHNPADYIVELACGEYGMDKIKTMVVSMDNGECIDWFTNPEKVYKLETLRQKYPIKQTSKDNSSLEAVNSFRQLQILMRRGWIKTKRDATLTHLRIAVNISVALMLGVLYIGSGNEGARVIDNFKLLFAILLHCSMATMMLTVLTFPTEMGILLKEHFNRWYSLKSYYLSVTLLDLPISLFGTSIFTILIYTITSQPYELCRFAMFLAISIIVTIVGQSIGLMVGSWFNVVNGTFLAPTITIPMMMFAGFGVTLKDLPSYMKWGSHISFMRYGMEGFVNAIYGENRKKLECTHPMGCFYKDPKLLLRDISMPGDTFWQCLNALIFTLILLRLGAYFILRWKVVAVR